MFKVGDKVYSDYFGDGVVVDVNYGVIYPIYVKFPTSFNGAASFTREGVEDVRSPSQEKNIRKVEDRHTLLALPDRGEIPQVFVGNVDFDKTIEDLERDLRERVLINDFSQKRLDLLNAVRLYLGKGKVKVKLEE
jgi:hypothetical protein